MEPQAQLHSKGAQTHELATVEPAICSELQDRFGLNVGSLSEFTTIRHAVTRFRITLQCLLAEAAARRLKLPARWATDADIAELPLTTPARRIAKKLADGAF
jgi:A/G-specific adenine glycosylase